MTLVEVIVVSALFALLMAGVAESIYVIYNSNAYAIAQAAQIDYARRGMHTLVSDMREMTYSDNGAFPLVTMKPNEIGFYSDIDHDNSVEYVQYKYDAASTTFEKMVYNATGTPATYPTTPDQTYTLSSYVQNELTSTSTFFYYDKNGDQLTSSSSIADVRYITAQIIVNVDPVRDPGEFLITGSAALRNLDQ